MMTLHRTLTVSMVVSIAIVGCSGDDDADPAAAPSGTSTPAAEPPPTSTASPAIAEENLGDVSAVIDRVKGSVVVVNNLAAEIDDAGEETTSLNSTGSGVVIDDAGRIVTNLHVVEGADLVSIQTQDGRTRRAKIIAVLGTASDLALLQAERPESLEAVALGDSLELQVGDGTVVVGNPVGIGLSAATGIVSARGRVVETPDTVLYDLLQTDAAINPGNSGGALLNERGELIGLNTAARSETEGIGFAIPVHQVERFIAAVLDRQPILSIGAGFGTLDADLLSANELETGVGLVGLLPDGPAEEAGLEDGDIIVELDGEPPESATEVAAAIDDKEPGASIRMRVVRLRVARDELLDVTVEIAGSEPEYATDSEG